MHAHLAPFVLVALACELDGGAGLAGLVRAPASLEVSFDPNSLLLSLLFSSVGFVLFAYGKKQARVPHMTAGVLLMVYPYFVSNLIAMSAVGVGIILLLWLAVRLGI